MKKINKLATIFIILLSTNNFVFSQTTTTKRDALLLHNNGKEREAIQVCEEELPAYFTEYLIYKLARKLCTRLTGDNNLLQEIMLNEQQTFNAAKNSDIKQQNVRVLPTGTFTDVRF